MKSIIVIIALYQLAFGGYIDCEHYAPDTECTNDDACYIDDTVNICRADCSKIKFFLGQINACNAYGCIANSTGYAAGFEGVIGCSDEPVTASPTTTESPTTPQPTPVPIQSDETKTPTESPVTATPTTTTTTTTTSSTSSTANSGEGRCKADGTVQEQVFGPQEYSCGDYNLGQPEERCLYIDASSSCTGTDFEDCGTETNAWPTFQSALDSLNGETVVLIVKAGTYTGPGNVNITSPNIHNLNEYVYLNIFSESGSDDTIIDCKGEGFGFHLFQTTIRLDGFTVINCIAPTRTTFSLPSYARNNYIQSAPETGRLGGAFFLDRTFITMNDMIIVHNQAEYGGGIFQYQNSIRMNNSIVEYNCATNSGGGVFLLFANLYMWNSYVICNNADVFGGGIFGHQQRTDVKLNAVVDDNTAEYADEIFCDQTTVNVETTNNGFVADNDVDSWGLNEVTYCCCNNCAFYNLDRSLDYCSRSDNSLIDTSKVLTLSDDQGTCETNDIKSESPTLASGQTASPTTTSISPLPSGVNGYKVFGVTIIVAIISFF